MWPTTLKRRRFRLHDMDLKTSKTQLGFVLNPAVYGGRLGRFPPGVNAGAWVDSPDEA